MARICIRAGDRAFVGELFGVDQILITAVGRGSIRQHRARLVGESLDSRPSWLPEALVVTLVQAIRAAAAAVRVSSVPPDPSQRCTRPDLREIPTLPARHR